jgi:hypothetical protein
MVKADLRRIFLQGGLACLGPLFAQIDLASAQEQTTIKFSFVLQADIVEPTARSGQHAGYSATLVLSGKGVNEQWTSVKLSGTNANYHRDDTGLGGRWRVLAPNTIGASWRMLNYTKSVTVRVSGRSCSVSYSSHLDPGQTLYRGKIDGAIYGYKRPVMIDPVCSIQ